ncbi:MAG: VPLPA-CTERM sorting domain-containing protein, partial [Gammaproteobacteria bacterium]
DNFSGSGTGHELGLCGNCTDGTLGFSLSTSSGVVFELDSFDLRYTTEIFNGTVTGHLDGGATVSQLVSSAGIINFDSSWMDLTSVDIIFQGDSFAGQPAIQVISVDNIYLQAVPIPAAVWLFGSGLGLLGWIRRKHNLAC